MIRKCSICGREYVAPQSNIFTCSEDCRRERHLQFKRAWDRKRVANPKDQPEIDIEIPPGVWWERRSGVWIAAAPKKEKRFYSKDIHIAVNKRDAWVRKTKFFELFKEISTLCQRYSFTINEFYSLLEPIVKAEQKTGGD